MPKLAWVLAPLALYGAWLVAALVRRPMPKAHAATGMRSSRPAW